VRDKRDAALLNLDVQLLRRVTKPALNAAFSGLSHRE
jgi:hypothetical protein